MAESKTKIHWTLPLKGMAMGMAEIIPGVSGGTIAFISGIYERLINAIKEVGPDLFITLKREGVADFWKKLDGNFLLVLAIGMVFGLVLGAVIVTWLLENHPLQLWGFFFGLILASFFYVLRDVGKLYWIHIAGLLGGTIFAYILTTLTPAEPITAGWFVVLSGMLAISALLLPGISGSFILLILGMYTYILPSFRSFLGTFEWQYLQVLVLFGIGCLIGVLLFSRIVSWLFKNYRSATLAIMSGFILGSLNKIWPWRQVTEWMDAEGNTYQNSADADPSVKLKIVNEVNLLPAQFQGDPETISVLISIFLGIALVFILSKLDRN